MNEIYEFFLEAYSNSPTFIIILEFIAVVFGIISVVYAKKENILVYPTGIICTVITIYLLYRAQYFGDMMMNIYYSIMSIYGWWNWSRIKDNRYIVLIFLHILYDIHFESLFWDQCLHMDMMNFNFYLEMVPA